MRRRLISVLLAASMLGGVAHAAGMASAATPWRPISSGEAFSLLHGREARAASEPMLAQGPAVPNFGRPGAPPQLFPQSPGLFGASSSSAPSRPLTHREVTRRLKQSVVIVVAQNRQTRGWVTGTGFFITPTHLLTNTHVVEASDDVFIANKQIGLKAARVVFRGMARGAVGQSSVSVGIDTAVIEAYNHRSPSFLPFAQGVEEGEQIAIAGFPAIALKKDRAHFDFMSLVQNSRIPTDDAIPSARFDFGYVLAVFQNRETTVENMQSGGISAKGSSGSPVVNLCGQVVGQIYQGPLVILDVQRSNQGDVAYGETVNYNDNLSFRALVKFLRASNIPFSQASDLCPAAGQ